MRAEHGGRARVLATERVTVGGIRGFFARQHYEATIEVDDEEWTGVPLLPAENDAEPSAPAVPPVPAAPGRGAHALIDLPARVGLAALLDDADGAEAALQREDAPRGPGASHPPVPHPPVPPTAVPPTPVSTQAPDFAAIMDDLTFTTAPAGQAPVPAPPVVPAVARGAGDLVVVAGLGEAALRVARSMADAVGAGDVVLAGTLATGSGVADRRTALAVRAQGVERGEPVVVAFGVTAGIGIARSAITTLTRIDPDQLWLAVDAGRKPDDTARWVTAIASATPVYALAVEGSTATATPATINELAIPVGWLDSAPSKTPRL